MKTRKQIILDTISDMMIDLLYYDRKEDDYLPVGAIEEAIEGGVVNIEEIIEVVKSNVEKSLKRRSLS